MPKVVSVACLDRNHHISAFSTYGDWVDIYAVGEGIASTTTILESEGFYTTGACDGGTFFLHFICNHFLK
jgi:hypothetical protein